jgi:hypothetical protein
MGNIVTAITAKKKFNSYMRTLIRYIPLPSHRPIQRTYSCKTCIHYVVTKFDASSRNINSECGYRGQQVRETVKVIVA